MTIDTEVMEAAISSCHEAVSEAHDDGWAPNTVHLSEETLAHLISYTASHGFVVSHLPSPQFMGLRIKVDDSIPLGLCRISEVIRLGVQVHP